MLRKRRITRFGNQYGGGIRHQQSRDHEPILFPNPFVEGGNNLTPHVEAITNFRRKRFLRLEDEGAHRRRRDDAAAGIDPAGRLGAREFCRRVETLPMGVSGHRRARAVSDSDGEAECPRRARVSAPQPSVRDLPTVAVAREHDCSLPRRHPRGAART